MPRPIILNLFNFYGQVFRCFFHVVVHFVRPPSCLIMFLLCSLIEADAYLYVKYIQPPEPNIIFINAQKWLPVYFYHKHLAAHRFATEILSYSESYFIAPSKYLCYDFA